MKTLLLLVVLAVCAYFAYQNWWLTPEPPPPPIPTPTPTPTPKPTPQVRLAPEGVFYVTKAFSVQSEDGITGFPMMKEVRLVREEGGDFIVSDGEAEGRAPKASFTNDLDVVDRLRQSVPPPAPISTVRNSPIGLEIEKTSRDIGNAERELQRVEAALKRTEFNLSRLRERIGRGEVYDGLIDLQEAAKELESKESELVAKRFYWGEMVQKLNSYKYALEEHERVDASQRDGTQDMARAMQEASSSEAKARAALEAHRGSPPP